MFSIVEKSFTTSGPVFADVDRMFSRSDSLSYSQYLLNRGGGGGGGGGVGVGVGVGGGGLVDCH